MATCGRYNRQRSRCLLSNSKDYTFLYEIVEEALMKCIFFAAIIGICGFVYGVEIRRIPMHDKAYNFQSIQPHEVASNYQILKLTDEVLRKHGVRYWAWGGTLIGAVRHKGFIPWDFDTDICVWGEDLEKMKEAEEDFKKYDGFFIKRTDGSPERIKRIKNGKEIYGHVDVAIMVLGKDGKVVPMHRQPNSQYDNHYFLKEEIEKIIRLKFGPITINATRIHMPYLYRGYGNDVMKMAEIMYTTNPLTGMAYEKFRIRNFRPAIYQVIDDSIPLNSMPLFP